MYVRLCFLKRYKSYNMLHACSFSWCLDLTRCVRVSPGWWKWVPFKLYHFSVSMLNTQHVYTIWSDLDPNYSFTLRGVNIVKPSSRHGTTSRPSWRVKAPTSTWAKWTPPSTPVSQIEHKCIINKAFNIANVECYEVHEVSEWYENLFFFLKFFFISTQTNGLNHDNQSHRPIRTGLTCTL